MLHCSFSNLTPLGAKVDWPAVGRDYESPAQDVDIGLVAFMFSCYDMSSACGNQSWVDVELKQILLEQRLDETVFVVNLGKSWVSTTIIFNYYYVILSIWNHNYV